MLIIGNILSFIASLIGLAYYKVNDKNKICMFGILVSSINIVSMFILGAYSGLIVLSCNILRALLTRFDKWNKYPVFIVTCVATCVTLHFYKSPLDFMSVIGSLINNIGFLLMQKGKLKTFRWMRFYASIMWISYYLYILNFTSMAFEIAYTIINLRELFRKEKRTEIV